MKKMSLLVMFGLVLAACSPVDPPDVAKSGNDSNNNRPEDVVFDDRNNVPDDDDDLVDDVDQNPNFPNISKNRTDQGMRDMGDDQDMLRTVVEGMPEFEPGMISIVGDEAWVNVRLAEKLSKEERQKRIKELEARLMKAMPRYEVHLNVNGE